MCLQAVAFRYIQLKVKKDTHRLIGVGNSGAFGKDIWRYEIKKGVICCGIKKNYINLHIH